MSKKPFADIVKNCTKCPNLQASRQNYVIGQGPVPCSLVILGDPPGPNEDKTGLPFQGTSGRILRANLFSKGLAEESYHMLHVLKCRTPGSRPPTVQELNCCRKFLLHQLRVIKPKVVLCSGKYAQAFALHTMPSKVNVRKNAGRVINLRWSSSQDMKAVLTYNHTYVMNRRTDIEPEFVKHIAAAKRLARKEK